MGIGNLDHLGRENKAVPNFYRDWKERPLAINTAPDGTICIASIPSGKGIDIIYGMKCEVNLYPDGTYSADILKSWHSPPGERLILPKIAPPHFKLPWEE